MKKLLLLIFSTFSFIAIQAQSWSEVQKIVASDRASNDDFSRALAIWENYAAVGSASNLDTLGADSLYRAGAAYIYKESIQGEWVLIQKLTAPVRNEADWYGASVDMQDSTLVVGAPGDVTGKAYIYHLQPNGLWSLAQQITSSDASLNDAFGYSCAIDKNFLVVGAPSEDHDSSGANTLSNAGSAYIFKQDSNKVWTETDKFNASVRKSSKSFGKMLDLSDSIIIVGVSGESEDSLETNTLSAAGATYMYKINNLDQGVFTQKITPADRTGSNRFGSTVAIDSNFFLVSALEGLNDGVYIYKIDSTGYWRQFQRMDDPSSTHWDGISLDIKNDYGVYCNSRNFTDENNQNGKAYAGACFILHYENDQWVELQKIVASDRGYWDEFGYYSAMSENHIIVGAPYEDDDTAGLNPLDNPGSAYIFELCEYDYTAFSVNTCDSYVSPGGTTYTSSATIIDTLMNAGGCDSIITIDLTIIYSSGSAMSPVACDSFIAPSGKTMFSSAVFQDTISNTAGCDSIITINLTVHNTSFNTISPSVCETYTSPSGKIWTSSNTYLDTIPNSEGCDSIITINLTILNHTSSTITPPAACDSYTSPGGKIWTSSNTYMDTIPNAVGCDSIMTFNITIKNSPNVSINGSDSLCIGDSILLSAGTADSYIWNNGLGSADVVTVSPTVNTTYVVTGTTNGCSGSDTLEVTALPIPSISISGSDTVCYGKTIVIVASGADSYSWNTGSTNPGTTVTPISDTSYFVMGTTLGCVGYDTFHIVSVPLPVPGITGPDTICEGDTAVLIASGAQTYVWDNGLGAGQSQEVSPSSNTTYIVTCIDSNSCTAFDTINISVLPTPLPTIEVSGNSLSTQEFASYQWYLEGVAITGETNQSYVPIANGDYSVEVEGSNGCIGFSDVHTMTNVGIENLFTFGWTISPNPSSGIFLLDGNVDTGVPLKISVLNVLGQEVITKRVTTAGMIRESLDLSGHESGIYLLKVQVGETVWARKLIKSL